MHLLLASADLDLRMTSTRPASGMTAQVGQVLQVNAYIRGQCLHKSLGPNNPAGSESTLLPLISATTWEARVYAYAITVLLLDKSHMSAQTEKSTGNVTDGGDGNSGMEQGLLSGGTMIVESPAPGIKNGSFLGYVLAGAFCLGWHWTADRMGWCF